MAAELLLPTARAADGNNNPYSGATWTFYAAGTSTPRAVYSDATLATSLGSTVTADSGGKFVPIYFNAELSYRGVCKNAGGAVTLHDIDPINTSILLTLAATTGAALIGTSSGDTLQEVLDDTPSSTTLAAMGGADLVGFIQAGTGANAQTVQDKLRERVSVLDFGADPTGVADSATAFAEARDYLATSSDYRGGIIYIPRGQYKLNSAWAFTPYVTGQVFNITIEGEGPLATHLDFSGCGAGVHGISAIGKGCSFHLSGLSISGAPGKGVILKGGNAGTTDYLSFATLDNVRVQGSGEDGIYSENTYMVEMRRVWTKDNTGAGLNFQGFHTSINANTCWASGNDDAGWRINGALYFNLSGCGSDANLYGYRLTNVTGVLNGCGAETNTREGIAVETGTTFNTGIPTDGQGVYLTMTGCYATANSTAGANLYANLLSCLTANSIAASVTMIGCVSRVGTSTAKALVLNAASGAVDVWGYTTMGTSVDSANTNTGGTIH